MAILWMYAPIVYVSFARIRFFNSIHVARWSDGVDMARASLSMRSAIIGLSRRNSSSNSIIFEDFWSFRIANSSIDCPRWLESCSSRR
jgi:hypothetical protein